METTYNNLSLYSISFFEKLKTYIDKPIYFFGSVQRYDYFEGKSDIDVDIFTESPTSTLLYLQKFLNVNQDDFKEVVWKSNNKLIKGHKIMYKEPENKLIVEFSIYDEKYKDIVLSEHRYKTILPYYIIGLLVILKFFYYILEIVPHKIYTNAKRFILNVLTMNNYDEQFVVF